MAPFVIFGDHVDEFTGTDDADSIVLMKGGGNISTGNGADNVETLGSVNDLDTGAGDDLVLLRHDAGAHTVDLGSGNDTMFVGGGRIDSIEGGEGDDVISGKGSIGSANLGGGDDRIAFDGHVKTVHAGAGNDTIEVTSTDYTDLGAGNDIFRSTGFALQVDGGDGNDRFEMSGGGNFDGGEGDDTFVFDVNPSTATTRIDGGAGRDKVVIQLDSFAQINFDQMSSNLSNYGQTGEAHLAQFNLTLKNVEVIEFVAGGFVLASIWDDTDIVHLAVAPAGDLFA